MFQGLSLMLVTTHTTEKNLPALMELMVTEHTGDVQYVVVVCVCGCLQGCLFQVVKAEKRNCMVTPAHLMA